MPLGRPKRRLLPPIFGKVWFAADGDGMKGFAVIGIHDAEICAAAREVKVVGQRAANETIVGYGADEIKMSVCLRRAIERNEVARRQRAPARDAGLVARKALRRLPTRARWTDAGSVHPSSGDRVFDSRTGRPSAHDSACG